MAQEAFPTRAPRLAATLLCTLACVLLFTATPALAALKHPFISAAGSGTLSSPLGLGVDQSDGSFYSSNVGHEAIDKFDASGAPVTAFGSSGELTGAATSATSFSEPYGVAVDNSAGLSAGDVYVADFGHHVVDKFTSSGTLVTAFGSLATPGSLDGSATASTSFSPTGVAVDPATGNLYVADNAHSVVAVFDENGAFLRQFPVIGVPETLAVDAAGDVFVANGLHVAVYDSTGAPSSTIGVGGLLPSTSGPNSVAVDPASGHVFVGNSHAIGEYDATGAPIGSFGSDASPALGTEVYGLGVRGSTGAVYAADANQGVVDIFGSLVVPTLTTGAASNLTASTATLNATLNPSGVAVTACHFEIVPQSQFEADQYASVTAGEEAPCSPDPTGLADSSDHALTAAVTALTSGATYHFRIVASNANGSEQGADETLLTPNAVSLTTGNATGVGAVTATLNATINPAGDPKTQCHFQYVPDSQFKVDQYASVTAGQEAPCPAIDTSQTTDQPVSAVVSGLTAATLYHFRIVGSNSIGSGEGADETFTTLVAVVLATEAATEVHPTTAMLHGHVDPAGNGEVTACHFDYTTEADFAEHGFTGPETKTASCAPATPYAGSTAVSAEPTGLNAETAYRFRVVATDTAGTADGSDLGFATPTRKPLVDSQGSSALTKTSAKLEAQVNPNGADATCQFEYVTTVAFNETGYSTAALAPCSPADLGAGSTDQAASAGLTGLAIGTPYHFRVAASNSFGTTEGEDQSFTTTAPDPPTVSTGAPTVVTQTTAMLAATINGLGADTHYFFDYGETSAYGTAVPGTLTGVDAGTLSADTPETIELTGLTPATTYHYRIAAYNQVRCEFGVGSFCTFDRSLCLVPGGVVCSPRLVDGEDGSFTTVPLAPVVTTGGASGIAPTAATVHGTVNARGGPTTFHVDYGPTESYGRSSSEAGAGSAKGALPVSVALSGLQPDTIYHYRVIASNGGGTSAPGEDRSFTTYGIAPAVTTGPASQIGQSTAHLSGQLDPQGSDTAYRFQYGTTTQYATSATEVDAGSAAGAQSVGGDIAGLAPATTYHYRLIAGNEAGATYGADQTFTTQPATAAGGPAPPAGKTSTTPPPPPVCKVPNLKGLTVTQARGKLQQAHCALGRTTTVKRHSRTAAGRIYGQSQKAGSTLTAGAKVNVTLVKPKPSAHTRGAPKAKR
ncbi:MAG TPA: PASTA domain-containing protein [Solirubrobacteraceae bacterium]|nr:PASTA domain-containing protein [Solirubrobacteraceae bacterium]